MRALRRRRRKPAVKIAKESQEVTVERGPGERKERKRAMNDASGPLLNLS
jgi:hypothetical protein